MERKVLRLVTGSVESLLLVLMTSMASRLGADETVESLIVKLAAGFMLMFVFCDTLGDTFFSKRNINAG